MDCNNDGVNEATALIGNYTCNYAAAGTYTVRIKDNTGLGTGFPRIYFNLSGDMRKLLTIEQWGKGKWTSMNRAFYGCIYLTGNATDSPDLSGVTDTSYMFSIAPAFNQDIGNWDTANVTSMSNMFNGAQAFNQDIGNWDTANVTNMVYMFRDAYAFNQELGSWNTGKVTTMYGMFRDAHAFNQAIGGWNTASVTTMSNLFYNAYAFNGNISSWDTASVTDMSGMFYNASAFNQDIGSWNTTDVTNMYGMFRGDSAFNQDIGNWNTSGVTDMSSMFESASAFNQDIGEWNTANVTDMSSMFYNASAFNQNIGAWNVGALTDAPTMLSGVTLSTANYDALLQGWNAQPLQSGVYFHGGNSQYCAGAAARAGMMAAPNSWVITDGGAGCSAPSVTTSAATNVTSSGATLNGTVNANNASTTVTFEYGADTTYGTTATAAESPVTGTTDTAVSYVLGGLSPNTTYHFRVVGQNSAGTTNGSDQTFTTLCFNAITVTNANDDGAGSLRQAVANACADGTITFSSSTSNTIIALVSPITIAKNLTIDGEPYRITVSGEGAVGVFVVNAGVTATLRNLTVTGGKADNGGGVLNNGTLLASNCAFLDNMALYWAGAIYNAGAGSSATIVNCTFSGNEGSGNAIANEGTLVAINSTFAQNASRSSTIYTSASGNTTLTNSLLSRAMESQNCNQPVGGSDNLADDDSCGAAAQNLFYLGLDGVLANHGGPTPNYLLLFDSPAIDAGLASACPATDQRGETRADWQCDIGAIEAHLGDLTTVSKTVSGPGIYTFGPTQARIEVTDTGSCLTGLQVERVEGNHPNATLSLQNGVYWTITPTGCTSGFYATLTLPFTQAGSESRLCRWLEGAGSGAGWDCDDGSHTTFVANTWVTRSGVAGFSDWAVGNKPNPTNVTLRALSAHSSGSNPVPVMMALFAGLALSTAIIRQRRQRKK